MSYEKKGRRAIIINIIAAAAFAIPVLSSAETLNLKFGLSSGDSGPAARVLKKFVERVKEQTDGTVNWRLYTSGSLLTFQDSLIGIQKGLADGVILIASYNATDIPAIFYLSGYPAHSDYRVTLAAYQDTILNNCLQCQEEYIKYNIKFMAGNGSSAPYYMCGTEGVNLSDALPKARNAALQISYTSWIQDMGGAASQMAHTDYYQALQTHAIDCVTAAPFWLEAYSLKEVVKSIIDMPLYAEAVGPVIGVSIKAWERMNETQKNVMKEESLRTLAEYAYIFHDGDVAAFDELKNRGADFQTPSPELQEKTAVWRAQYVEKFSNENRNKVRNIDELNDAYQNNINKWSNIINAHPGMTVEQFTDLLREHFFNEM